MMKSIALNDSSHPADEEGFVLVDSPQSFGSVLLEDDDEASYDHCEDAFSFSSLHQTLSTIPAVQDNFFEPAEIGQEVIPPAAPEVCPSLLGSSSDDYHYEDPAPDSTHLVIPRFDSDTEELGALVSPAVPNTDQAIASEKIIPSGESTAGVEESLPVPSVDEENAECSSLGEKDSEDSAAPFSSSSSSMGEAASGTDDDVASSSSDKAAADYYAELPVSRVSKKKRRKQLKLAKKAAAAAAAAAALGGHLSSMRVTTTQPPKRGKKSRKKIANIAVSCAVQSLAEYKDEVERTTKLSKKIH